MDITRHLNCEPVVARPPSRLYEFQKTVRRHSFGFAAAVAVFASLVLGLGVSAWMFFQRKFRFFAIGISMITYSFATGCPGFLEVLLSGHNSPGVA
jgi:hypothetical protein